MLKNLADIEVAYSILRTESNDNDPVDDYYDKLNCDLQPLDPESDEFKRLLKYVENTHGPTHTNYKIGVKDIFKVSRAGEEDKYARFRSYNNRKLLWHGSRLTNFPGILSQGLKIAPPGVISSGQMVFNSQSKLYQS